jgi:hypothetical protein
MEEWLRTGASIGSILTSIIAAGASLEQVVAIPQFSRNGAERSLMRHSVNIQNGAE